MIQDQGLELSIESETHILDLNFDCLHKIFSLECFTMLDLCSIGEAHYRFKEVVDDVFAKRHKHYEVNLCHMTDLETPTKILSNFGPFISKLSIVNGLYLTRILLLDLLIEHCSGALESIELISATTSEPETIKLQQIFGQLQNISLYYCDICSAKKLFSNCESLVELKLHLVIFDDQDLVLENTFPKLERFEFSLNNVGTDLFADSNKTNDFFSRHQHLKTLKFMRRGGISHLLPAIADNCKQLAELDIAFKSHEPEVDIDKALASILTLDHLNKLKINSYAGCLNVSKFAQKLKNLKSLQVLSLSYVQGDSGFVSAVSELTRLQKLKLWYCGGLTNLNLLAKLERLTEFEIESHEKLDFDLVYLIKHLNYLKNLYLNVPSIEMDKEIYLRIVDAVGERGRFQDALQISCLTANDVSANTFGDADCRKLVRIIKLKNSVNY